MGSYIPISSKDNFDNNSTDAYLLTTESTLNALRIVGRFDPMSQTGSELPKYPKVGVKVINPGSVTINSIVYNVQKNDIIFNNKEIHSDKDEYTIIRGGSSNWSNILFDKTGTGNNSILRIKNPTNAIYRNGGSITGVIKIQCPGIIVANMLMKLKVSISDDNNATEEYNILISTNSSGSIASVRHTYLGKNQNPDYISAVVNSSNNPIIYIGLNSAGSISSKNLSNCIIDLSNIHISYNITDMTSIIKQWVTEPFNISVVSSLTELEKINELNNLSLLGSFPSVPVASGLINGAVCGSATFNGALNVNSTASIKVTGGQQSLKLINEFNNGFLFYPTTNTTNNLGTLRYTSGNSDIDLKFDGSSGKITYKGYELGNSLGFTPVQQGGGSGQLNNKVYIGSSNSGLKAQVDSTDLGMFAFQSWVSQQIANNGFGVVATDCNSNGCWMKLQNRIIIQWGFFSPATMDNTRKYFPISFTVHSPVVIVSSGDNNTRWSASAFYTTLSSFVVKNSENYNWIAIGY